MHRVRQLLPALAGAGWKATVLAVDPAFVETYSMDPMLLDTVPGNVDVRLVKAWPVRRTRKFGLGSLSLRSILFFRKTGNSLLRQNKFDLVFFSTTAFHVMALGPYWKWKFGVPFVLDIQDPWRNDFYLDKPTSERPPKFFINYQLDKILERFTVPRAAAIITVSAGYADMFRKRYEMTDVPVKVIPFGMHEADLEVAHNAGPSHGIRFSSTEKNIVYVGRGGFDMQSAMRLLLEGLRELECISGKMPVRFWFLGTDYAPREYARKTFEPIAAASGQEKYVTEITDRLPYFETLRLLQQADGLFIPGSTDPSYTASKIFPYLLAGKPLLAIFHRNSAVVNFIREFSSHTVITLPNEINEKNDAVQSLVIWLKAFMNDKVDGQTDTKKVQSYLDSLNRVQIDIFNQVVAKPGKAVHGGITQ